ncbi:class I SAM-dependent methyltransferase [Mesonia aestuariivivens]|uniref:Class I SAM-dependent methyltransferase n=1 Tax=Mesonia aestuariivivens TaxID=2796128 RepID=A0ABS6VZ23_9FLAO|nr:class I SAM-dependent methyltransferase [Mesonia aestuariivivens]MBW2960856.1 class I SAM-dependent methyltransferase [Mesonia aestuariivivens]
MYKQVKLFVKKIIPQEFLFKNELLFKKALIPFYKGNKYSCIICGKSWKKFISLDDHDLLCPYCGSRSRTRRLFKILNERNDLKGKVLHFSPSRSLFRIFKEDYRFSYYSTDFENEFLADYKLDITKIDMPNNSFDTIICYHILEHIEEDQMAMEELLRVLKPNGKCYIQTPFKTGGIYEDYSIKSPEKRLEAFGQEDHVRIYSIEGLTERLNNIGFKTEHLQFEEEKSPNGLLSESVIIASKPLM